VKIPSQRTETCSEIRSFIKAYRSEITWVAIPLISALGGLGIMWAGLTIGHVFLFLGGFALLGTSGLVLSVAALYFANKSLKGEG
jgi:hypothetical protein